MDAGTSSPHIRRNSGVRPDRYRVVFGPHVPSVNGYRTVARV